MFGIKKVLTISNDKSSKSGLLEIKEVSNSHSGDDSKFIYYAKTEEFISQLEIYVKPSNYPNRKVLIVIKSEEDFGVLYSQIEESLKSISEFKNIKGLKVEKLYKLLDDNKIILPTDGPIYGYLKSGDIIYCDVTSDEFWITTYFKIRAYDYRKIIKLEYKFPKKTKFKQIKLILLKAGIGIFWEELKKNNIDNSFNYFVKQIKFNNNRRKKAQTGFELINFNKKMKYLDPRVEIFVNLQFGHFEELIHEQLTLIKLSKNDHNYLRLNEYCNLAFEELLSSKKFESELNTIKDISREFLKSQNNDINTPLLFYNIKKTETVDEYMYNIINTSNSYEPEIEDDEEEDENDFEEDTSFGKFYSEDPSKFFGNITRIKKTKKNYIKKYFDANMIIVASFLFNEIKEKKKELKDDKNRENKIFRTFAHEKLDTNKGKREKLIINDVDINNFFISPLSLENDKNNILKDDQNNLLYNDNDNDNDNDILNNGIIENNLYLDEGNIDIENNDKLKEDNYNKIFGLDEQSTKNNRKRYTVKLKYDDAMSHTSKKTIFSIMRLSRPSNCCNDLYNCFSQAEFLDNLKKNYKYYISKKVLEKIIIPESRDYENIDKDFLNFLKKKESEEEESLIVKNKKLIIFLCIFFIYYILILITTNLDLLNIFI